jgi:hypothetical protein
MCSPYYILLPQFRNISQWFIFHNGVITVRHVNMVKSYHQITRARFMHSLIPSCIAISYNLQLQTHITPIKTDIHETHPGHTKNSVDMGRMNPASNTSHR